MFILDENLYQWEGEEKQKCVLSPCASTVSERNRPLVVDVKESTGLDEKELSTMYLVGVAAIVLSSVLLLLCLFFATCCRQK